MAILLSSKIYILSKQRTISTEAQLRQAAKEALERDDLLRWRWKAFEPTRARAAAGLRGGVQAHAVGAGAGTAGRARRGTARIADRTVGFGSVGATLPRAGAELSGFERATVDSRGGRGGGPKAIRGTAFSSAFTAAGSLPT